MEAATRIDTSGVNQAPGAPALVPGAPAPAMDREFIIKNQIVERYLAGRLPPKGVTDFEKLIRSRPQLIEELGLADRVNAGLRLLDAAGIAEPWAEKQKKVWEKPAFTFAAAGLAAAALIGCLVLAMQVSSRDASIVKLKQQNHERPVEPSTRKRPIMVSTARNGPPSQASLTHQLRRFRRAQGGPVLVALLPPSACRSIASTRAASRRSTASPRTPTATAHLAQCGCVRPRRLHGDARGHEHAPRQHAGWLGIASRSNARTTAFPLPRYFRGALPPCR